MAKSEIRKKSLNRKQSREVDRRAMEQFGMCGLVLMENAGRGCVDVMHQVGISGLVVICCGKGNNAGDGFVIARHLESQNIDVRVWLFCEPDELRGDAATNYEILNRSGTPWIVYGDESVEIFRKDLAAADWVVDALLGTGARGEPRAPLDRVIDQMNKTAAKKLAVDVPSGLDCDTGKPAKHSFRADHTCTFVHIKDGFRQASAVEILGEIHVVPIGIPRKLLEDCHFSGGI